MKVLLKNIEHTYMKKTPFEKKALANVNVNFEKGLLLLSSAILVQVNPPRPTYKRPIEAPQRPGDGRWTYDRCEVETKADQIAARAYGHGVPVSGASAV